MVTDTCEPVFWCLSFVLSLDRILLTIFCVLLIESDVYTDSLNQTRKLYDAYAVKNVGETLSSYNMVIPSLDLFCDLDIRMQFVNESVVQ